MYFKIELDNQQVIISIVLMEDFKEIKYSSLSFDNELVKS